MVMRPGQLAFMPRQLAAQRLLDMARPAAPAAQVTRRNIPRYQEGPRAGQAMPPYMDAAQLAAAAAQSRTPPRMMMPMEMAAMRAPQMRGMTSPAAPSTFGQRVGTALRQPLTSPTGMGLATAALTGLEMAGPQPVPTSTGQILARAGMAGLQAYAGAQEAQREREAAEAEAKALADYRASQLDISRQELDVRRKAAEAAASAAAGKAVGFENETKLRKEYDKSSEDFKEAKLGFEKVQNAASAEPSGANDLAIIFGYMKVLDPGSVVREGEFANAENTAGVPDRIRNIYNKLREGQRLSDPQRANFIASARTQFAPYIEAQAANETRYRGLSDAYGFKSDNVVTSYLPEKGSRTNPHVFETEQDAEQSGLKGFAYIGGRLAEIK